MFVSLSVPNRVKKPLPVVPLNLNISNLYGVSSGMTTHSLPSQEQLLAVAVAIEPVGIPPTTPVRPSNMNSEQTASTRPYLNLTVLVFCILKFVPWLYFDSVQGFSLIKHNRAVRTTCQFFSAFAPLSFGVISP